MCAKLLQSCPTLCDPVDYGSPGSSVRGIFQARIQEWFAMPSFRGSSWPRDRTHIFYVSCTGRQVFFFFLPLVPPGKSERWKALSCVQVFATSWTIQSTEFSRPFWSGVGRLSLLRGSSQPRDQTQVFHIAGGFFTSWTTREAPKYWSGKPIPSPVDFPDLELNQGLLHCRWILYQLSCRGSQLGSPF